ncbi:MAG: substrate-binding domain-containing protein [Butyricicoccus sp.]
MGIPVVTFNTDIADANRIAYVGPDNIAAGRAAAALMGMVMQGHGSVLPILGQRSGHYADSQRYTGFWAEMAENFPNIRVLHPECSFLDESLAERIAARAIQSDSSLRGIYLTSAGREGVYRAVNAGADERSEKIHVVVHDITDGNVRMVKKGTVDFIIGQDVKTQGTLPIRLLYDYLERHQFPKERMNMTDITIKFRGNV